MPKTPAKSRIKPSAKTPEKKRVNLEVESTIVAQSMEEQLENLLKKANQSKNAQMIDASSGESIVMLLTAALHSLDKRKLDEILKKKHSPPFIRRTVAELPNDLVMTLYDQIDERIRVQMDTRVAENLADWLNAVFTEKSDYLKTIPINLTSKFAALLSYIDFRTKNRDQLCGLAARTKLLSDIAENKQSDGTKAKLRKQFETFEHQKPKKTIDLSGRKSKISKTIKIDGDILKGKEDWWSDSDEDAPTIKRKKDVDDDSDNDSLSSIESLGRITTAIKKTDQAMNDNDDGSSDDDDDAMLRQEDQESDEEEVDDDAE